MVLILSCLFTVHGQSYKVSLVWGSPQACSNYDNAALNIVKMILAHGRLKVMRLVLTMDYKDGILLDKKLS